MIDGSSNPDYVEAEYGVPHCKFEYTVEGFRATFNKVSLGVHKGVNIAGKAGALGLVALPVVGAVALAQKAAGGTVVEVTGDAVIIDGKRLARRDFSGFNVYKSWEDSSRKLAVLGYQYGFRGFEFGGAWEESKANEIASALNKHLRKTPLTGDENSPTPEEIKNSRPTDF